MTTTTFRKIDLIVLSKQNSIGAGLKTYEISQQNLGTAIQPGACHFLKIKIRQTRQG
jgi:hypothetical protein